MKIKLIGLVVISSFLFGCSAQTFTINGGNAEVPTSQKSQTFFIEGIGQEQVTDAAKVCGGAEKIMKVEAQQTFINGLLGAITWGIYSPRAAKVYCKK